MESSPRYLDQHPLYLSDSSHGELRALVGRFATELRRLNLPDQSRIALLGLNSVPYFAAIMGIRQAGHVAVPLHLNLPRAPLRELVADLDIRVIFADADLADVAIDGVQSIDFARVLGDPKPIDAPVFADPDRLALLITTSGSTGRPKVVAIPEKARRAFVLGNLVRTKLNLTESVPRTIGTTVISSPLSHILAINMAESLFAANAGFVLLPKFDPVRFIQALADQTITELSLVPSMWALMLRHREFLEASNLDRIRKIYFSSERLSERLLREAIGHFPRAEIENCYGISEAGPNLFGAHPAGVPRPGLSVGHPRPGFQYRLVHGELEIKTPYLFRGYVGDHAPASSLTEDGFYRTGDKFVVDENGFFFFQGRTDDLIVTGGKKVYPAEIQSALEKHSDVAASVVLGLPDETKGEKPYAFVVLKNDAKPDEDGLKQFMLSSCPPHFLPRKIWFLETFPLRPNLKINRGQLREMAQSNLRGK